MTATDQPNDAEQRGQPDQSKDADSTAENQATEPQAEEVEDLKVADEEISEQVRGGRRKLDQDMDPY